MLGKMKSFFVHCVINELCSRSRRIKIWWDAGKFMQWKFYVATTSSTFDNKRSQKSWQLSSWSWSWRRSIKLMAGNLELNKNKSRIITKISWKETTPQQLSMYVCNSKARLNNFSMTVWRTLCAITYISKLGKYIFPSEKLFSHSKRRNDLPLSSLHRMVFISEWEIYVDVDLSWVWNEWVKLQCISIFRSLISAHKRWT